MQQERRQEASTSHSKSKLEMAEDYYETAKRFVSRALKEDEKGERMSALELYNKALNTIQSGLSAIQSSPQVNSVTTELKTKLEKVKKQVKSRMQVLLDEESHSRVSSSRSTNVSSTTSSTVMAGGGRGEASASGAEADLIFSSSVGAKVFRISTDGQISKCVQAENVNIFKYRQQIKGQPPAFLQCGDYVYPLIPGQSPILRSTNKAYLFPDVTDSNGGNVAIMVNPGSTSEEMAEMDQILSSLGDFRVSQLEGLFDKKKTTDDEVKEGDPTWGTNISEKLTAGVSWVSEKLSTGTEKAGEYIAKGGDKLRGNIEPNPEPTVIPQPVEKGAHYARKVAGTVVGVSDFLMMSLAKGTVAIGKKVGSTIAESDMVKDTEVNPHAKEAWKVTKSSVKGVGKIFGGLEDSARALIKGTGKETSKTVEHKYGEQAGKVTDDSLATAGHTVDLASVR